MKRKHKIVLSLLFGNCFINIYRISTDEQPKFALIHHEFEVIHPLLDYAPEVHNEMEYSSFEDAFTYLSEFQWPNYFLYKLKKPYRGFVLEKLIEKLNMEFCDYDPYYQEDYKEKGIILHEHKFKVSILQDSAGSWSYSVN